jgi:hypothetical protein
VRAHELVHPTKWHFLHRVQHGLQIHVPLWKPRAQPHLQRNLDNVSERLRDHPHLSEHQQHVQLRGPNTPDLPILHDPAEVLNHFRLDSADLR